MDSETVYLINSFFFLDDPNFITCIVLVPIFLQNSSYFSADFEKKLRVYGVNILSIKKVSDYFCGKLYHFKLKIIS